MFFEPVWRWKLFQMIDNGVAIDSIKFSSKSELTSRFFSRLKFRFFFETSNGRLPLEISSDRPQTWPKRVSDDPRRFIFRLHFFFRRNFREKKISTWWNMCVVSIHNTRVCCVNTQYTCVMCMHTTHNSNFDPKILPTKKFCRRKMKRRGSSETRFGQVWGRSELISTGKRPFEVSKKNRKFQTAEKSRG